MNFWEGITVDTLEYVRPNALFPSQIEPLHLILKF